MQKNGSFQTPWRAMSEAHPLLHLCVACAVPGNGAHQPFEPHKDLQDQGLSL